MDKVMELQGEELSLEAMFQRLEETVGTMEREDLSLEDSFVLYHDGMEMLRRCSKKIESVEKQILVLDEEGETHEFER